MEIEHRRHLVGGFSPMSVLAMERGISLIRYTNFSEKRDIAARPFSPEKCGFVNLGNTCFMNSILQCLRHTKPLMELCHGWKYDNKVDDNRCMNGNLFLTYVKLMKLISKGTDHILPLEFMSHVTKYFDRFRIGSQQDAQEFLIFIIEKMHADLKFFDVKFKDSPIISRDEFEKWDFNKNDKNDKILDIFVGDLKSTIKCTRCKSETHILEQFLNISLPTPESQREISLMECLFQFMKQEELTGENKPMCGHCQSRQKFLKSYTIDKFPLILVIHLKRYNKSEQKTRVEFPLLKLELSKFSTKSTSTPINYKLYAVSNHHGNLERGHYTAIARGRTPGEWYHYNDSRVTRIDEDNVVSQNAYLLFYERFY